MKYLGCCRIDFIVHFYTKWRAMKKYYVLLFVMGSFELCGSAKSGKQNLGQSPKDSVQKPLQRSLIKENGFTIGTAIDPVSKKVMQAIVSRPDGTTRAMKYDPVKNETLHREFDATIKEVGRFTVPGGLDLSPEALAKNEQSKLKKIESKNSSASGKILPEKVQQDRELSDAIYEDGSKFSINVNGEPVITLKNGSWIEYQADKNEFVFHSQKDNLFGSVIKKNQIPAAFNESQAMQNMKKLLVEVAIDMPQEPNPVGPIDTQVQDIQPVAITKKFKNITTKDEFIDYSDGTRQINFNDGSVRINFSNGNHFEYAIDGKITMYSADQKGTFSLDAKKYEQQARLITSQQDVVDLVRKIQKDTDAQMDVPTEKIVVKQSRTWFPLFNSLAFKGWIIDSIRSMMRRVKSSFQLAPSTIIKDETTSLLHNNS